MTDRARQEIDNAINRGTPGRIIFKAATGKWCELQIQEVSREVDGPDMTVASTETTATTDSECLRALYEYYMTSRRAGHTTAMLSGALNMPNALIVTLSQSHARDIARKLPSLSQIGIPRDRVVAYESLASGRLKGLQLPLLIDNAVLTSIFHQALTAMEERDRLSAYLHSRESHPDYEYATTDGPRMMWENSMTPPSGGRWSMNLDRGHAGWQRFDYHEESYWRRTRS